MVALAPMLNVVSSSSVMPSAPLVPVRNVSPLKISSLSLSAFVALARVTVALPWSVTTVPMESAAVCVAVGGAAGGEAGAGAGGAG